MPRYGVFYLGRIIDFRVNENNINNISFYNINKNDYYLNKLIKKIELSDCNKHSDDINNKFDNLKLRVKDLVPNDEFRNKVLARIDLIKNYSDKNFIVIEDNMAIGYINNNDYLLIAIKNNKISFSTENDLESSIGEIRFIKDKYFINYKDELNSELIDVFNKRKKISNINVNNISMYNSNHLELANKKSTITNNYDVYYENHKKIVLPNKFNNKEVVKLTRVDDSILKSYNVKYLNKSNYMDDGKFIIDKDTVNREEYYVGYNFLYHDNNIPDDIYYQDIDYEVYNGLKCKKK